MKWRARYSLVFLLALISFCSKKPSQEKVLPSSKGDTVGSFSPLDKYFGTNVRPEDPGLAVLVMASDSLIFSGGFGISDIKTKEPVTTHTLFNIGSISKTFVSNAILILRDQGALSLDDNLVQFFPEFKNKEIAKDVRLRHLLTHTSGLPDSRNAYGKDSIFYLTAKDKENWAPIMETVKLNFEPGSRFEYSNPAFNGLALIIEQVAKKKWQSFVAEKILLPSGMKTSTITDGPHPRTGVAHGYIRAKGKWMEKDYGEEPTFAAAGNGGVWSSVEELALYEKALRNATFLKRETIDESTRIITFPNWTSNTSPTIGWSWFISQTKEGKKIIGHTGSQGGFRANYVSVPEKKWLIIILSAAPRPLEEYTARVFEFLDTGR